MNFADSVVFITGANRGLGLAFAKAALAAGVRKVYAAARDPSSITLEGVERIELDVRNPDQVAAAVSRCSDVTLLINNAGISLGSSLLAPQAIAAAREELEVNFFGPWNVASAFAPVLAVNGGGAIVNVLSALSWVTFPSVATYSASKSAAWSLTNGLRNELKEQGTQVVALHVGYMDTDMTHGLDVPKSPTAEVARATLAAVEAEAFEVLADEVSRDIKRSLSSDQPAYAG